jgi:hypothetical protein
MGSDEISPISTNNIPNTLALQAANVNFFPLLLDQHRQKQKKQNERNEKKDRARKEKTAGREKPKAGKGRAADKGNSSVSRRSPGAGKRNSGAVKERSETGKSHVLQTDFRPEDRAKIKNDIGSIRKLVSNLPNPALASVKDRNKAARQLSNLIYENVSLSEILRYAGEQIDASGLTPKGRQELNWALEEAKASSQGAVEHLSAAKAEYQKTSDPKMKTIKLFNRDLVILRKVRSNCSKLAGYTFEKLRSIKIAN